MSSRAEVQELADSSHLNPTGVVVSDDPIIQLLQSYALALGTTGYLHKPQVQRETVAKFKSLIVDEILKHEKATQEVLSELRKEGV